MRTQIVILLLLLGFTVGSGNAEDVSNPQSKAGYMVEPGFGGPNETGSQLAEDDAVKEPALRIPAIDRVLEPWFTWKGKLKTTYGLELGLDYRALYQGASAAPEGAEDRAGSGIVRLRGRWSLLKRDSNNTGALVFSTEHRHRYTAIAPADLGFSVGYLGIPGTQFSDIGRILGDLNWQQRLNDGNAGILVGRYDPNDFFDVLGYANPATVFQNLAILLNASIALPDWSTGLGVGHWFNDQWQILAAVNDVNGVATEVEFFEDFGELYATAEFGWSPSKSDRYLKNVHVTGWHADEREKAGVEESQGIALGANWTWNDTWMIFTKAGWSEGSAPLYNESITIGGLYFLSSRSDLIGLGANWGNPSDESLREQWSGELFYRLQLAQNLAITPSVQLVVDPTLNPDEDQIWLGSIRARFTL